MSTPTRPTQPDFTGPIRDYLQGITPSAVPVQLVKDLEDQLTASVAAPNNDFDTLAKTYRAIPFMYYQAYVNMNESEFLLAVLTNTSWIGASLLQMAAFTGRPIAYPLLQMKSAMADQQLDDDDTFSLTELKAALYPLWSEQLDADSEKYYTTIAANAYVQGDTM